MHINNLTIFSIITCFTYSMENYELDPSLRGYAQTNPLKNDIVFNNRVFDNQKKINDYLNKLLLSKKGNNELFECLTCFSKKDLETTLKNHIQYCNYIGDNSLFFKKKQHAYECKFCPNPLNRNFRQHLIKNHCTDIKKICEENKKDIKKISFYHKYNNTLFTALVFLKTGDFFIACLPCKKLSLNKNFPWLHHCNKTTHKIDSTLNEFFYWIEKFS